MTGRRRSVAPGYARPFSEIIHRIPIVTDPLAAQGRPRPNRAPEPPVGHRHHGSSEVAPCYRGSKKFRDSAYIVTPAGSAGIGGAVPQVKATLSVNANVEAIVPAPPILKRQ